MKTQPVLSSKASHNLLPASQLEKICYRLGASLKAGIPILQVWENETQMLRGRSRRSFDNVFAMLQKGDALADGLAAERSFPPMLIEMVRAGEETGQLDQALLKLADHYRAIVRMKRTFLRGVTWPVLQLIAAVSVISALFLVLHVLQSRVSGLVAPDVFLLGLSPLGNLLLFWGVLILLTVVGFLVVKGIRSGWFGTLPMRVALAIPLLGGTIKSLALSRFAWVLGTAVDAGINAQKAIRLGLRSTQNRFYQNHESSIVASVVDGNDFLTALSQSGAFPSDLLQAVQAGELTGQLTESLERLSDDYREESALNLQRIGQISGFGIFMTVGTLMALTIMLMYAGYLSTLSDAIQGQSVTLEQIRQGQQTTNPIIATRNEMVKDFVENNEDFKKVESIYEALGKFNEMTPGEFLDRLSLEPERSSREDRGPTSDKK
jgi:type II secretory pathway component PulF